MPTPSRQAVIIGINNYADTAITDLTGAKNDALELRDHLTTYGDFTVEDHHLLIDSNASAQNIRKAISDLLWETEECELSLFYFSGHGLTDSYGNGFIAAYDTEKKCPLVCGIRMQELKDLMLAARNKKAVLIILDCCYSGIASYGDKGVGGSPAKAIEACLAPLNEQDLQGRFVMTSAGSDERSREIADRRHTLGNQPPHPHGAFTFQILEGLDGRASTTESEITVNSLFSCVSMGFKDDNQHKPKLYGSGIGSFDIMLCRASPQVELERQVQKVRELISNDTDTSNLFRAIKALKNILDDSPKLREAVDLRDLINSQLKSYRTPAVRGIIRYKLPLEYGCQETFSRLQNTICGPKVDFDVIAQEDDDFQILILSFFELTAERIPLEVFKTQLSLYEAPKGQSLLRPPQEVTRSIGS